MPINPSLIDEFDPDAVPTVGQLLNELDNVKSEDPDAAGRRMEGKSSVLLHSLNIYADKMCRLRTHFTGTLCGDV